MRFVNLFSAISNQVSNRYTNARFSGDVDAEVTFEEISITRNGVFNFGLFSEDNSPVVVSCGNITSNIVSGSVPGLSGAYIEWADAATGGSEVSGYRLSAFVVPGNNTEQQCGAPFISLAVNPVILEISRTGIAYSFYYNNILFAGPCFGSNDRVYAHFNLWTLTTGLGTSTLTLDNFHIVRGLADEAFNPGPVQEGYRRTGNWTSEPFVVSSTGAVQQITVGYGAVNATWAIDKVDLIYSGNQTVIQSFPTDLTSGTEKRLNVSATNSGTLAVRVYLKGDGTASPLVTYVSVEHTGILEFDVPFADIGVAWGGLCLLGIVFLSLSIALIRKMRG